MTKRMKKIIGWMSKSNRWRHLLGGVLVGIGANSLYCALYAGVGVASALELKDRSWYGVWDWTDWAMTLAGVAAGYGVRFLVCGILRN